MGSRRSGERSLSKAEAGMMKTGACLRQSGGEAAAAAERHSAVDKLGSVPLGVIKHGLKF